MLSMTQRQDERVHLLKYLILIKQEIQRMTMEIKSHEITGLAKCQVTDYL